jgi:isoleucyl-tRNA synthetase
MEEVAKRVEVDGIQAWWDLDSRDILALTTATRKCRIPWTCGSTPVYPLFRG